MKIKNSTLLLLILGQMVIWSGVVPAQTSSDSVLARVGKEKIYLRQFEERFKSKNLNQNNQPLDLDTKKLVLDELIDEILVEKKAAQYDFKDDPALLKSVRDRQKEVVLDLLHQRLISAPVSVSDSEVEAYYQTNREAGYKSPEAGKIRQIFISFEKDGKDGRQSKKVEKEALAKCKELLRRLKNGADFGQLARTFSNHPSASEGGEMGFVPRGELPPEVEEVLYSSPLGLIQKPIKSSYGYHVIELEDRQEEHYQELTANLREAIKKSLQERKEQFRRQEVLDSLRQIWPARYNQEAIAKLNSNLPFEDWLLIVGKDTLSYTEFLPGYQQYAIDRKIKLDGKVAQDYLKIQTDTLTLLQAALALKLDSNPEAKQEVQQFTTTLAKQKIWQKMSSIGYRPSKEEIKAYYDRHRNKWTEERPLHVQHIIFPDSASAASVREQILAGMDFRKAALEHYPGEPEIREVAYDLGFIAPQEMPQNFYQAADRLQVGEISQPAKTEFGWHIIKLMERKGSRKFEEVEPEIERTLSDEQNRKALQEWRAWLRRGVKIRINGKLLDQFSGSLTRSSQNPDSPK